MQKGFTESTQTLWTHRHQGTHRHSGYTFIKLCNLELSEEMLIVLMCKKTSMVETFFQYSCKSRVYPCKFIKIWLHHSGFPYGFSMISLLHYVMQKQELQKGFHSGRKWQNSKKKIYSFFGQYFHFKLLLMLVLCYRY